MRRDDPRRFTTSARGQKSSSNTRKIPLTHPVDHLAPLPADEHVEWTFLAYVAADDAGRKDLLDALTPCDFVSPARAALFAAWQAVAADHGALAANELLVRDWIRQHDPQHQETLGAYEEVRSREGTLPADPLGTVALGLARTIRRLALARAGMEVLGNGYATLYERDCQPTDTFAALARELTALGADAMNGHHEAPLIAGGVVQAPEADAFPTEVLPRVLRDLTRAGAAAIHCAPELIAVPALVACGTAIGLSRVLKVKAGRSEPALLWAACVARSSQGKSPAETLALRPLRLLQRELHAQFKRAQEEYRRTPEDERDGPPPSLVQTFTTNSTLEALGNVLLASPRGVALCPDELTAWTLAMNQYKGGHGSDRPYWLSMHSLTPIVVNRVSRHEPVYIEQPFVAVVGGLQPDVLPDLMPDGPREDGFLARVLFAYPPVLAPQVSHAEPEEAVVRAYESLVKALYTLDPKAVSEEGIWTPQEVGWGKGGRQAWLAWCADHDRERSAPDFPDRLLAPWGKMDTQCARLVLGLHQTRLASEETHDAGVDADSVDISAHLIRYFKSHARRVYALLGANAGDRQLLDALAWLQRQPDRRAKLRDLYRGTVAGCRTKQEARDLVARLDAQGWARVVLDHGQGGPSEVVELV